MMQTSLETILDRKALTEDQLTPQFLDVIPQDPFNGEPLRYVKLSPRGFVIYSVGKDRADDGGKSKSATAKAGAAPDVTITVRR